MEGRWLASSLLRDLRQRQGLTQHAFARLADVPQPTVSEIEGGRREPSLTLLSKLAEAVGQTLEVRFVPLDRYSAVAASQRMAERLNPRLEDATPEFLREDSALRAIIDFREALRRADLATFDRLVRQSPTVTGATRWDALLAAVVEDEAARRGVAPPRWTNDRRRFAKPVWYLSENPALHDWELETAPAAFVRHGVLAAVGELESV